MDKTLWSSKEVEGSIPSWSLTPRIKNMEQVFVLKIAKKEIICNTLRDVLLMISTTEDLELNEFQVIEIIMKDLKGLLWEELFEREDFQIIVEKYEVEVELMEYTPYIPQLLQYY